MKTSRLERIRNAKGSNQYSTKKKARKDVTAQWMFVFLCLIVTLIGIRALELEIRNDGFNQAYAEMEIVSPVGTKPSGTPIPTPTLTMEQVRDVEEIDSYIDTIFRGNAKVAKAVYRNECGVTRKEFPRCRFTTPHEDSVGLFQINLQSKAGKVHYDRVPGETLEEKVEWLKYPKNNVLVAYWIFQHSGWNPWTAYTSGNYLKDM